VFCETVFVPHRPKSAIQQLPSKLPAYIDVYQRTIRVDRGQFLYILTLWRMEHIGSPSLLPHEHNTDHSGHFIFGLADKLPRMYMRILGDISKIDVTPAILLCNFVVQLIARQNGKCDIASFACHVTLTVAQLSVLFCATLS